MASKLDEQLKGFQDSMNRREADRAERTVREPGPATCITYRVNDEMACRTCGLRWDCKEDQPPCPRK